MSGHSHYRTIKRKKELSDSQRSKVFSKFANEITVAVRQGGKDPLGNPRLRQVLERAKEIHMSADNIERATKKGTGELTGAALEDFLYEAYGPGNIALLIEGITDNKNRILGELKHILQEHGGKLVGEGGVRWMFQRKGAEWQPRYETEVQAEEKVLAEKLFEALNEHEAVQEIYSNLKE